MDICKTRMDLTSKYLWFWYNTRKLSPTWPNPPSYDEATLKNRRAARVLEASELAYMRHLGCLGKLEPQGEELE